MVWLFQIFGAPSMFLAYNFGWGVTCDKVIVWKDGFFNFSDWQTLHLTKLLSSMAISIFCLNGVFVIMDERKSWEKMDRIFIYLNRSTEFQMHGWAFLVVDAITNCWTVIWCCLSTLVVIGPADGPKDVIFDSLGLLFLYNL